MVRKQRHIYRCQQNKTKPVLHANVCHVMTQREHVSHHASSPPSFKYTCYFLSLPTKSAINIRLWYYYLFPINISFNSMAQNNPQHHQPTLTHQVTKASTAIALSGSLQVLSGLTLTGTVIALVLVTPLLVLFSPVLVPAAITLFLLFAGFVTSISLGSAGAFVLYWMYSYAVGKHPIGAQKLDELGNNIASIVGNKEGQGREEDWAAKPQAHRRLLG